MLTEIDPSERTSTIKPEISRRAFLTGAGTIGIVAAVGGFPILEFFTRDL